MRFTIWRIILLVAAVLLAGGIVDGCYAVVKAVDSVILQGQ